MKAVIQRVKKATVSVDKKKVGEIGKGLLVYLGIGKESKEEHIDLLVKKITELRIFPDGDKEGVFSVRDIGGEILLISQFTLYGDVRKGRRPSFSEAMDVENARIFYEKCLEKFNNSGVPTKSGVFQAMMEVESINFGPYTIILEI
ncbi:MAG: D-aminoacyl-tRNA deacylase [Brevinematales bacterium]|nr:D-aminoacyl-tRNA deacylase [Brevinematales bacterium]